MLSGRAHFSRFFGWSLLLLGQLAIGNAEVVRIYRGDMGWAQGWLFLDTDGRCKVVTAGHVAKALDGGPAAGLKMLDTHGHEMYLGKPEILPGPDDIDIAVLPVPVGDISSCNGRVSEIGAARRIEGGAATLIETTHNTEWLRVPVRQLANQIDAGGGELFSVELTGPGEVAEGWSGSVVMDGEGPLGIVFAVQGKTVALAVRIDAIRRLIDSKRPAAPSRLEVPSNVGEIVLLAGSTPNEGYNPDKFLRGAGNWHVVPSGRQVAFALYYHQPIHLGGVRLAFDPTGGNAVEGIDIATSDSVTPNEWQSLNFCRAKTKTGSLNCAANAVVSRIRVTLNTANNDALTLSGFTVQ
jgi:hypothetical protein